MNAFGMVEAPEFCAKYNYNKSVFRARNSTNVWRFPITPEELFNESLPPLFKR